MFSQVYFEFGWDSNLYVNIILLDDESQPDEDKLSVDVYIQTPFNPWKSLFSAHPFLKSIPFFGIELAGVWNTMIEC